MRATAFEIHWQMYRWISNGIFEFSAMLHAVVLVKTRVNITALPL